MIPAPLTFSLPPALDVTSEGRGAGSVGSIVGKLVGLGKGHDQRDLERHLAALDGTRQRMAREVATFVATGEGGAILSTLSLAQVLAAWKDQARTYPRQTPNAT